MEEYDLEEHLSRLCNAVGGYEVMLDPVNPMKRVQKYVLGAESKECLKDIKKLLRWDDKTEEGFLVRKLGEWNFMKTDLIPIFIDHPHLRQLCIEIMVPLTWPLSSVLSSSSGEQNELAAVGGRQTQRETATKSLAFVVEQKQHLIQYKSLFTENALLTILSDRLISLLEECSNTVADSQADNDISLMNEGTIKQVSLDGVRMILTLIRNLLVIQEETGFEKMHQKFIKALDQNHFMLILNTLIGSLEDTKLGSYLDILLLDLVWSLLYLPSWRLSDLIVDPDAKTGVFNEFLNASNNNNSGSKVALANSQKPQTLGGRPPNFKGNFVVTLNQSRHLVDKPDLTNLQSLLDKNKKGNRQSRKKKTALTSVVNQEEKWTQCTAEVRVSLNVFMEGFLAGPFNILSEFLKKSIIRERDDIHDSDRQKFFQVMSFTIEYLSMLLQIPHSEKITFNCVADVLDVPTILLVIKLLNRYVDAKKLDMACCCLDTFYQIMNVADLMMYSDNDDDIKVAESVLSNLFTRIDHLKEVTGCVTKPQWQEIQFLKSAVRANHLFVKSVEKFSQDQDLVIVKKIKRRKKDDDVSASDVTKSKKPSIRELPFEFSQFESEYCHEHTVNSYVQLLNSHQSLSGAYIHYIASMLHRIFYKRQLHPLLFKIDVVMIFESIMKDRNDLMRVKTEYKELVELIRYFTSVFLDKIKDYPLLFVELFYPKIQRDIDRIQNGIYHEPVEKIKKVQSKAVKETEIITGDDQFSGEEQKDSISDVVVSSDNIDASPLDDSQNSDSDHATEQVAEAPIDNSDVSSQQVDTVDQQEQRSESPQQNLVKGKRVLCFSDEEDD
ncbi:hypothetical protein MIR68_004165 [Amoeboaphelidium protococcarum]|nr:hypothetical protein MIR68_004165 [Amoeboaphelidium protococcarum]